MEIVFCTQKLITILVVVVGGVKTVENPADAGNGKENRR